MSRAAVLPTQTVNPVGSRVNASEFYRSGWVDLPRIEGVRDTGDRGSGEAEAGAAPTDGGRSTLGAARPGPEVRGRVDAEPPWVEPSNLTRPGLPVPPVRSLHTACPSEAVISPGRWHNQLQLLPHRRDPALICVGVRPDSFHATRQTDLMRTGLAKTVSRSQTALKPTKTTTRRPGQRLENFENADV